MQNVYIFHQEAEGPEFKSPWPVVVASLDGEVTLISGRPDATHIIGFAEPGHYEISILASDVFEAPDHIIGLTPVFSDGNFFGDTRKVADCREWTGTPAGLEALQKREAEYREALGRVTKREAGE